MKGRGTMSEQELDMISVANAKIHVIAELMVSFQQDDDAISQSLLWRLGEMILEYSDTISDQF